MTEESTLLIVKPDAVRRGLIGEVLGRVEAKGLRIAEMRMMEIGRETAEEHYGEYREKPFFGELAEDRKSTRLNSSHSRASRMPSSA